jgi:uncharacterized repeat protein (TIGR03803 family)
MITLPAQAQTFTLVHNFTGSDGSSPTAGVTMDQGRNLYGTASLGGHTVGNCFNGCGTVYKLTHKNSSWTFTPLYLFNDSDGSEPLGRVTFGPDGRLYGTTSFGGAFNNGVVFSLQPPATICKATFCSWRETVLYSFTGGADGLNPGYGDLAFDRAGNIYGTTMYGGINGEGTVYKLSSSHGVWSKTVLHSFGATAVDGQYPYAGVVLDGSGNLYGTTFLGGQDGVGAVYELQADGWSEITLHSFDELEDGYELAGGLIFDSHGNLYGVSSVGGPNGGGAVYELNPSNGSWNFSVLYGLTAYEGSQASVAMDTAGNVYGTMIQGWNEVFRLTPSNGQWELTGFSGGLGIYPFGNITVDAAGNLYTTAAGGDGNGSTGVVFQITP